MSKKKTSPSNQPWMVHIHTDGSLRPPDAASCAYIAYHEGKKAIIDMRAFAHRGATINQMELTAINHALDIPGLNYVTIYSDSSYTIGCLGTWRKTWALKDWISPEGTPYKNKDLIIEIGKKIDKLKFCRFVKVKAHSGDFANSVVDYMAQKISKQMMEDPSLQDGRHLV